jgi:hypothetical protein
MTDDSTPKTRRMILEAGSPVILHPEGPAGGFPLVVSADRVSGGVHWFLGSIAPLRRGESLIVESPIPNDARYATRAKVVGCSPETFGLEIQTEWERVQERAFVRVSAHGFRVRVVRLALSDETDGGHDLVDDVFDLIDVSAGGIRFRCDGDFETDENVVCHFELPGSLCFVLPGRIVRPADGGAMKRDKPSSAVEFVGLDETNRSQLLRWAYREQVRRHHEEARRDERKRARDDKARGERH